MWEVLLGTAAANKAASIGVGLSVLLAGAGTAEVTGIGPLVREAVHLAPPADEAPATTDDGSQLVEDVDEIITLDDEEESAHVDQQANGASVMETDEAPGNLVWHENNDSFKLRGLLVVEGETLLLRTAGPDGELLDLVVDLDEVEIHVPSDGHGKPADEGEDGEGEDGEEEDDLAALDGRLAIAMGTCGEPLPGDEDQNPVCTVESISLLGNAGQNPDDEDLEGEGSATLQEVSDDLDDGNVDDSDEDSEDEDGGEDSAHGKPDHAGGPKQNLPTDE
jgi:hypothetical protein